MTAMQGAGAMQGVGGSDSCVGGSDSRAGGGGGWEMVTAVGRVGDGDSCGEGAVTAVLGVEPWGEGGSAVQDEQ